MHEMKVPARRPPQWSSLVCTAALPSSFVRPRSYKPHTSPGEENAGLHFLRSQMSSTQQQPVADLGPRAGWLRVKSHMLLHSGSGSGSAAQTPHRQHASPHSAACDASPRPAGLQQHRCRSTHSDRLPCLLTAVHSISGSIVAFRRGVLKLRIC